MGKIRVKTFGDEEEEKKQQDETKKRNEAKKAEAQKRQSVDSEKTATDTVTKTEEKTEKKAETPKKKSAKGSTRAARSKKYQEKETLVDRNKLYKLTDALALLPKIHMASFDETVELHMNTTGPVSGATSLPNGTGKQVRVAIADGSDTKAIDELVKKIEGGAIEFDILVATPDAMPRLAKVARVLGPRGLMPNPKNGTVSPKAQEVAKKFAGGQMNFKTEAKAPILHMIVGKMSFGEKKLEDNIVVALQAVNTKNVKSVTLKSTMSAGLKIDFSSL